MSIRIIDQIAIMYIIYKYYKINLKILYLNSSKCILPMKFHFQIFLFILFLSGCSKSETEQCTALIDGEIQLVELDQAPTPINEPLPWLGNAQGLKYPAEARENDIEGTVDVEYAISESGKFQEISIINDIGGGCGDACLDFLSPYNDLTLFNPGIYRDEAVKVYKVLPIVFKLE